MRADLAGSITDLVEPSDSNLVLLLRPGLGTNLPLPLGDRGSFYRAALLWALISRAEAPQSHHRQYRRRIKARWRTSLPDLSAVTIT